MTDAFAKQFPGRKLGVRHIPAGQEGQLDHIPIYGKIDMSL